MFKFKKELFVDKQISIKEMINIADNYYGNSELEPESFTDYELKSQKTSNTYKVELDITDLDYHKIPFQDIAKYDIKIGNILIKIKDYNIVTNRYCIECFEYTYKTLSGKPCKMIYKLNVSKDYRCNGKDWLSFFNLNKADISINTLKEIIKWFKITNKLAILL